MLARHITSVGRQVGRQCQTCDRVLCKFCTHRKPVWVKHHHETMLQSGYFVRQTLDALLFLRATSNM